MDLKRRLSTLQRQAGTALPEEPASAPPFQPESSSVAARLARAGASRRERNGGALPDQEVAARLGGEVVSPGLVIVERYHALSQNHGRIPLGNLRQCCFSPLLSGEAVCADHLLFIDTETTGLAGGTGTLPFLLGLGRLESEGLRVRQFFLTGFRGEPALLDAARSWIGEAQHLVSFNGKGFDLPLLVSRYRLARMQLPFDHMGHIDLLYPTRRAFASIWPDCKLQTAEKRLLGFIREDDLPGYLVPQVWFDFVRRGAFRQVPDILEHNRWDLVSLGALLPALAELFAADVPTGADALAIARAFIREGRQEEALRRLEASVNELGVAGRLELGHLYRRMQRWEQAVPLWHALAEEGVEEAMERLAKYCEHVQRDYPAALRWVAQLQARQPSPLHEARLARLRRKAGR